MAQRDELIDRVLAAQRELQHLMTADRSNPLLQSTLTMQQLKVLILLSHIGGSSGQELAGVMDVSMATVTGIVDRLVAAGLAERREDPQDRRVRRITLTDAGRETVDGIVTAGQERLLALLGRMTDDELRIVEESMALFMRAATAEALERAEREAPSHTR